MNYFVDIFWVEIKSLLKLELLGGIYDLFFFLIFGGYDGIY